MIGNVLRFVFFHYSVHLLLMSVEARAQSIEFLSGAFSTLSVDTISKALDDAGGNAEVAMENLFIQQEDDSVPSSVK